MPEYHPHRQVREPEKIMSPNYDREKEVQESEQFRADLLRATTQCAESSPELRYALTELFAECPAPFVLDEDNKSHLVVKDCCGGEVLSSHLPPIGVSVYNYADHLRARLIARVLVQLSKEQP